jgi:putative hemolysin
MLLMWSALARYLIDGGYEYFIGAASIRLDADFNCADLPVPLSLDRLDARFARHFLKRAA